MSWAYPESDTFYLYLDLARCTSVYSFFIQIGGKSLLSWLNKFVGYDSCLFSNCKMCDRKSDTHINANNIKCCSQPVTVTFGLNLLSSVHCPLLLSCWLCMIGNKTNTDNSLDYCIFGIEYFS